jgi:hypothetical protein
MKNGKEMGYHEKHRRYYAKATKMYFEDGLGYQCISKLIPVAATTVKNWCITFAGENGIKMEKKAYKVQKPVLKTPESTGIPNYITAFQAEVAGLQKELKHEKLRADVQAI